MPSVSMMNRLERYSLEHPQEVFVIHACVAEEPDEVVIFKGFSSSLMRSTAYDLDLPVLPDHAEILSVDRLEAPFNPQDPKLIEHDIPWIEFQNRLGEE